MNAPDVFALALNRITDSAPKPPPCPVGELELVLHPDWLIDALVCRFDCQDGEPGDSEWPGSPEVMDLQSAWLGSVDISGALGDKQIADLEDLAVEELEMQRECAEIDAAEARHEWDYG